MKEKVIKFSNFKSKNKVQNSQRVKISSEKNNQYLSDVDILKSLEVENQKACIFIKIAGDSMFPIFSDGQLIIVDSLLPKQVNINKLNNKIVMVSLNGSFIVRTLVLNNKDIFLVPSNSDYETIKVSSNDDFNIFGVVLYNIRSYKV